MIIAFAGASGTGKTTLACAVAKHFNIPINPVGSRSVAKDMGFDNPYDIDAAGKRVEFQKRLLDAKLEWELEHHNALGFVTDRTPYDNLVYTLMHAREAVDAAFMKKVREAASFYDSIFYLPQYAYCDPKGDPNRVQDPTYHEIYDVILNGFLERYEPRRVTTLIRPGLAERTRLVLDSLSIALTRFR